MHGILREQIPKSKKARLRSWPKKTPVPPIDFGALARFAYPVKTLESLGAATGAPRSTIKTWLNGSHGVPGWVLAVVTAEIMRQVGRR